MSIPARRSKFLSSDSTEMLRGGEPRADKRKLLLFFTSADHPQRDAACATLAWLAAAEGSLFECYFDSAHGGIHFGGGHPGWYEPADLRGSTVSGGRHVEMFHFLLQQFDCEAACLGPSLFEGPLRASGIPVRSWSGDIGDFYRDIFELSIVSRPNRVLIVGDGGRPQGISLSAYAFPEIVNRRLLAVSDVEPLPTPVLAGDMTLEGLWLRPKRLEALRQTGLEVAETKNPTGSTVAEQTAWMAERWRESSKGFLIGDPELVGRWTPSAVRNGWTAIYGIPQSSVIDRMSAAIAQTSVAHGRQHHDQDFVKLSKLGVGFQVIDPGSPPFPVVREVRSCWPKPPADAQEPSDEDLQRWAHQGRVPCTLLFWTGMIRELQNLYPLADLLSLTGLHAGLVLTTESFAYMAGSPLNLVNVPRDQGGLFPRVETLLTDTGSGVLLAADAPRRKFAATLQESMEDLADRLGDPALLPKGWWAHMDAPMTAGRAPRISWFPDRPHLRLRYTPRTPENDDPGVARSASAVPISDGIRSRIKKSPLGRYFAPLRPYESSRPGLPALSVLESVRDAGFEYAITKSSYGHTPKVVADVRGLTVLNHTAGRWDGWSPFHTVNTLSDLKVAEQALLRRHQPGWLLGAIDTCLWTFTGPVWKRGTELDEIARWLVAGGSSGRLVNVTPRTMARYAGLLGATDHVGRIPTGEATSNAESRLDAS